MLNDIHKTYIRSYHGDSPFNRIRFFPTYGTNLKKKLFFLRIITLKTHQGVFMQYFFSHSIPLALAFTMLLPSASQAHVTEEVVKKATTSKEACAYCDKINYKSAIPFLLFATAYIRLHTKSSAKEKIERNWQDFLYQLSGLLNVTQIGTAEYRKLIDDLIIGYPLKLLGKDVETVDADNPNITTIIEGDKIVKQYPSGMMGYFDAYVLLNLKKLFESIEHLDKITPFIFEKCA